MSGLSFLHVGLLLGALGVAAPIIIHFIFRRRAKVVGFPPMRFVLLSYKKVARRLLLREYLLLAARCLMVLFLALALAAPVISRVSRGLARGEKPLAAVMIIDGSPSMWRKAGKASLFETARETASDWIGSLADGDRAGVIDASRLTSIGLLKDPGDAIKAVGELTPSYSTARLVEAVSLASSQLAGAEGHDRVVIVFTDLQASSWTGAWTGGDSVPIRVVDMSEGLVPRNVSIDGLEVKRRSLAREEAAIITAKIKNHGEVDERRTLVRVAMGGQTAAQGFVDLTAGDEVEKEQVITDAPGGAGVVTIEVDDGMTADNSAYFMLSGGQKVRALLVDGDPGTGYLESETYFLEQALDPRLYAKSRVQPAGATPAELNEANLDDYQVLILANVEAVPPRTAAKIKAFVEKGGGLLFTLGDRVRESTYNEIWKDLLPRELRGVKLAYAGATGADEDKVMHLDSSILAGSRHPALALFSDPGQGDLGLAGFWKYFLMQQEVGSEGEVLLRLTDGAPILVEKKYGRGKVMLFAGTADRAWNDLCVHPTYLPLFQQIVRYLGDALVEEDSGKMAAGVVLKIPVATDVTGARVKGPDGAARDAELIEDAGRKSLRVVDTELPGVYRVRFARGGGRPPASFDDERADATIVLNLDPAESDLTKLGKAEIESRVKSGNVTVTAADEPLEASGQESEEKVPFAWLFLYLMVGALIIERALMKS